MQERPSAGESADRRKPMGPGYGDDPEHILHQYDKEQPRKATSYQEQVLSHWSIPQGARVLDVAGGRSEHAPYLEQELGARVTVTDISEAALMLRFVDSGGKGAIGFSEATQQPFPDETLDAIQIKDAILHIEDRPAFFLEAARLLKSGGKLLVVSEEVADTQMFYFYEQAPSVAAKAKWKRAKPSPHVKDIHSPGEYERIVELFNRGALIYSGNKVGEISPPYFQTDRDSLIRDAEAAGFSSDTTSSLPENWKPAGGEAEWTHAERFVLGFVKT